MATPSRLRRTSHSMPKPPAMAAAKAAIQLIKGQKLTTTGTVPNGSKKEAAYIIPPVYMDKSNWRQIYTSGFLKKGDVCNGEFKKFC